jgi:predicted sulfurtransferase
MGIITIYYKYVAIEDPHAIMRWQKNLCIELGLKGRILIAKEGINGTVGGTSDAIAAYKKAMLDHPFFTDLDFKDSPGEADHFSKLRVVIRPEIVHLGLDTTQITARDVGKHLSPEQAHQFISQKNDNTIVLDTRNKSEWKIGRFNGAVNADIEYFRELPAYIDQNIDLFKGKEVLMACTAGVRCERASAYLKSKNVATAVYQIKGGIHRYVEQFPDGEFRGKNYVFDGRISVKINDDIVGTCDRCGISYDEPSNCINAECNRQLVTCPTCREKWLNTCSEKCSQLVHNKLVRIRTKSAKIEVTPTP